MRNHFEIKASADIDFKSLLLAWLENFECFAFYDSCSQPLALNSGNYDWIAAAGARQFLAVDENCLKELGDFQAKHNDWLFGGFCYELKDELEALASENPLPVKFPKLFFFVPEHIISLKNGVLSFSSYGPAEEIYQLILMHPEASAEIKSPEAELKTTVSKQEYAETVEHIREHIRIGDIYEMNYCVSFTAENASPDPLQLYRELSSYSPAPFSALFRWHDAYLISASPERFLMKKGDHLLSQPIKGTAKRGKDEAEDVQNAVDLKNSEKERAENVMIVDLVRNDLSRSCKPGSVKVDELFGIYSFPAVHQMISSVSGTLRPEISSIEAIANAFPMGSMTGAPKIMSMKLIEKYERTARGIYSGSVGYFDPDGDFDFNVVIRSIMLDKLNRRLSFHVGSAITFDSKPDNEYEECMLKAKAIKTVLERFGIMKRSQG